MKQSPMNESIDDENDDLNQNMLDHHMSMSTLHAGSHNDEEVKRTHTIVNVENDPIRDVINMAPKDAFSATKQEVACFCKHASFFYL